MVRIGKEHKKHCPAPSRQHALVAPTIRRERQDKTEPEEDSHRLTQELKLQLDHCKWIREELDGNQNLFQLIATVDAAKNRPAALAQARASSPSLRHFIDRVLLDLGVCERSTDTPDGIIFVGVQHPNSAPVATLAGTR